MKHAFALVLLAAAIIYLAAPSSATAGGYGCGGGGCGYGGYYSWLTNHVHTDRLIPYFAQHPPVYYSYPVPRTYGYSPYAYGPCVMTPDGPPPLNSVSNPYVSCDAPAAAPTVDCVDCQTSKSRPAPLVVLNPYVVQGATVAEASAGR